MAKPTFIKAARKPIYERGKRVEYVSQKGKREGQTISKIDRTIPADENDKIFINKGESYYTWSFMYGTANYSKTRPRQSQLTQSNFMSQYYAFQERIDDFKPEVVEDIETFVDTLISDLEGLRDETQDSLDNMPDSLQESPTGQLLAERVESLEETISELENIGKEYEGITEPADNIEDEDEDILSEIADEEGIDMDDESWKEFITSDMIQSMIYSKIESWLEEKTEELAGISWNL